MCTNQCEENCFCHVKKRPRDPFHCQCKAESFQNPIKRASEVTTSTAPMPDESTKIEEEVKVNMGIETIRATTKIFKLEGGGGYIPLKSLVIYNL